MYRSLSEDLIPTAGVRTTYGSPMFEKNIPDRDAIVVERLKSAGAILLGKTNTPELGAGINTKNPIFGATLNPWNTTLCAGGSSGGAAAALAAGLGPLAQGSDHGGSLRIPASYCGVVAFRTTAGLVPNYPTHWVYDPFDVTGPMSRTVADTALMLSVIAGPDDRVPISINEPGNVYAQAAEGDVAGTHVAWSVDLGIAPVDPEVASIFERAVQTWAALGCEVEEAHPDMHDVAEMILPLRAMRAAAIYQDLLQGEGVITNEFFKDVLELARKLSALDVGRAEAQRSGLWERCTRSFRSTSCS